ncbi:hypothetical protein V8E36_004374 [Tilletia maclaganii]
MFAMRSYTPTQHRASSPKAIATVSSPIRTHIPGNTVRPGPHFIGDFHQAHRQL